MDEDLDSVLILDKHRTLTLSNDEHALTLLSQTDYLLFWVGKLDVQVSHQHVTGFRIVIEDVILGDSFRENELSDLQLQ